MAGAGLHNIVMVIRVRLHSLCMVTPRPRTKHQEHEVETISRSGVRFPGYQEFRDKDTFEIVPPEKYQGAYKITYRQYVEEWTHHGKNYEIDKHGNKKPCRFVYYQVSRRSSNKTEQIGRITEYTTEERLQSLLYRYFNLGHALGLSFRGRVRLSGPADGLGSKMPYVVIPNEDVARCDLRVDDEISYSIINSRGEEYTEKYHLSQTAKPEDNTTQSMVIPLTRIKRLVILDDGTGRARYVRKAEYDLHTELLEKGEPIFIEIPHTKKGKIDNIETVPVHRFINEGEDISVMISPEEYTKHEFMDRRGRFDFVAPTLQLIAAKRRAEARWMAKHPDGSAEDLSEDWDIDEGAEE